MIEPSLVSLSLSAFLAVLVVLSFLALAIRFLTFVFREQEPAVEAAAVSAPVHPMGADEGSGGDAALVAALHAVIARHRPDARIVRIDETTTRGAS